MKEYSAAELDMHYGAMPFQTGACYMRAEFLSYGMDEPYVAYFQGFEAIERFARREFIYDTEVKVSFTAMNLAVYAPASDGMI